VDIKYHKEEKDRTRLNVGGDQIDYPGDKSTREEGLTTAKILINSVISNQCAKFLIDIKNFYLKTPPWTIQIYGHQLGIALSRNDRKVRYE
jgi:hypothetical protein